jgi:hypothetical protein
MMRLFSFVLIILFLSSCNNQSDKKVTFEILKPKKMIDILIDLNLLEAKVTSLSLQGMDSSQVMFYTLQNEIFKKHKTDSLQYQKNYQYYLQDVPEMQKIYIIVGDTLRKRDSLRKLIQTKKTEIKKIEDSENPKVEAKVEIDDSKPSKFGEYEKLEKRKIVKKKNLKSE